MFAFAAPVPPPSRARPAATTPRRPPRPPVVRMVSIAPPQRAAAANPSPEEEHFSSMASAAAEFLSLECRDHLANYVVQFGNSISDLALINEINVSGMSEKGLDIDVVTCDQEGCVCLREQVAWLKGKVLSSADDIPEAIRHLSKACGLDDSII